MSCPSSIVALNQVNRVVSPHNSFGQNGSIHAGATSVAAGDLLEDRGRRWRGFRIERNHFAALVLLHHAHSYLVTNLQFAANQLVLEKWNVFFPARVEICAQAPGI